MPHRLNLTMIVYGSSKDDPNDDSRFCGMDQRRVEITASPLVPSNKLGRIDTLTVWAENVAKRIMPDAKHSQEWHCAFCGAFPR